MSEYEPKHEQNTPDKINKKQKEWKPQRIRHYGVFERADEDLFPPIVRKSEKKRSQLESITDQTGKTRKRVKKLTTDVID